MTFAHGKADKLSIKQVKLLSAELLKAKIIKTMRAAIWKEASSLLEPQIQ